MSIIMENNNAKILMINPYVYLPGEHALKRTMYLFELMSSRNIDVTFLTSDFNHYSKQQRNIESFYKKYPGYVNSIRFIHMKPYRKNISLNRFWAWKKFEKDALRWFKAMGKDYDAVYLTLPSPIIAKKIRSLCDAFKSKLIIDVNDLWPDSLRLFFKNDIVYNLLTYPIQKQVRVGYANADGIVAVSDEYRELAEKYNNRYCFSKTVYIGAMIDQFDHGVKKYAEKINKVADEYWITYVGTIGTSYDFVTVIDAVNALHNQGYTNIRFRIFGQGPEEQELKEYIREKGLKGTEFLGFVDYDFMAANLVKGDISINCIKARASQSIINKAADYFAAGKPILNCGPSMEMQKLVSDNNAGINYIAEDIHSLEKAILHLYNNPKESIEMGANARTTCMKLFDRKKTHQELIDILLQQTKQAS